MTGTAVPRRRRGIAAVLVAVVVAVLALHSAGPAHAAQNIDPQKKGSLTIHKFAEPPAPTGGRNDGTDDVDTTGLEPLKGVTFTIERVTDIDLTKDTDWQKLGGLTPANVKEAPHTLGPATTVTTGEGGVATASDLPIGLYLVTETTVGDNHVTHKSEPFLVTIPLALTPNEWLYDVHAYPKNTVTEVTKAVDDTKAFVLGDTVTWTVDTQAPSLPEAVRLDDFRIVDTFDARLAYADAKVTVDGVEYAEGGDYTVAVEGQKVTIAFTQAGRDKLRDVQGKAVTVVFDTTVRSIDKAATDEELAHGVIPNRAHVFVNDPEDENGVSSKEVQTEWGALKVLKYAKDPEPVPAIERMSVAAALRAGTGTAATKPLQGAQFEIYALGEDGKRLDVNGDGTVDEKDALKDADDDTRFTTGADGTFLVSLKAGDYEVVEVVAPLGYKLDSTPHKVTVPVGGTEKPVELRVPNTQIPPFELPLTGGLGTVLFVVGGLVLFVIAALIVARALRARRDESPAGPRGA